MNWPTALGAIKASPLYKEALDELLAHPYYLLRSGLWLEFGVGAGHTLRKLAAARGEARVVGFDSFKGLPEDWRPDHPKGEFAVETPPEVPGAEIVVGLFEDTLPAFLAREKAPIRFVHIDSDLYSSARTVLRHVTPRLLEAGAVILFDELLEYEGHEEHELRALREEYEDGLRFAPILRGWNQAAIAVTAR